MLCHYAAHMMLIVIMLNSVIILSVIMLNSWKASVFLSAIHFNKHLTFPQTSHRAESNLIGSNFLVNVTYGLK